MRKCSTLLTTILTTLIAALSISNSAIAHEAGDIILRAGVANVSPDVTDKVAGGALSIDVEDNTQIGLTAAYLLTPQFGVQLLGASPFSHDVTAGGTVVGSTKHLPPTVTLQWYPAVSESVHPYVGIGINYTTFWDSELNATGQAATGASKLGLTYSTGLALEAGVDVKMAENIYLNAAVWKVDINTDVKLDGVKVGELEIDPLAFMIGVGYKF
ncbi:MAG: OmpW family outer membrane protein [Moraxellaceae bacterium]|nr:OmpW family outer membrane protein [Moraxellaceae bacterium]